MENIEDVTDIEDLVKEEEPEPEPDESALFLSRIAYNLAVTVIDAGTGYLVWQLTFWYYGLIWFLAGAVVFFLHQKNYFTAGNNDKQLKGSLNGVIVSVVSIAVMAVVAGALWVLQIRDAWVEIGLIFTSLSLFFWHTYRLAKYVFDDDGFRINNSISRAYAQANKKIKTAKAGGKVAGVYRQAQNEKNQQYNKHGKGNIDAALSRINNTPMNANAKTVEQVKPSDNGNQSKNL